MMLSEDRQVHLAHVIADSIWDDDLVDYTDEDMAIKLAKRAIIEFIKEDEAISKKAQEKVASLKRGVLEGTPEWDVLFRKYYEEELNRKSR